MKIDIFIVRNCVTDENIRCFPSILKAQAFADQQRDVYIDRHEMDINERYVKPSYIPQKINEKIEFTLPEILIPLSLMNLSYIKTVLNYCNGNKVQAAKILGVSVKTVHNKVG